MPQFKVGDKVKRRPEFCIATAHRMYFNTHTVYTVSEVWPNAGEMGLVGIEGSWDMEGFFKVVTPIPSPTTEQEYYQWLSRRLD